MNEISDFSILLIMNKKNTFLFVLYCMIAGAAMAGNPDRQGEAGANQLLINPWARTAGFHAMNTSIVSGTDAFFLNIAGLSRIERMQFQVAHTNYLSGTDLSLNSLGFAQRLGKGGAFGFYLSSFDLGDFESTSEDTPEGSTATFSPSFFNLGISYSHLFSNKVSVGFTAKMVNEAITNASARAFAFDGGVQYVTGPKDNFKFGVSLRNVGSKMRFTGEGLSKQLPNPGPTFDYPNTYYERSAAYELPSQLNIGFSYDWLFGKVNRLTFMSNFTSNAFSRDQGGAAVEFAMGKVFAVRCGYKTEFSTTKESVQASIDNGVSAGFSIATPVRRNSTTRIALDYGYRTTTVFKGIHNLGIRLDI
jgi:hypothetical protein